MVSVRALCIKSNDHQIKTDSNLYISIAAFKKGGRWPWLVCAATTHGFFLENVAYFAPFIENFWHAQGIVTFLDRRMALYIVFLCR